MKEAANHQGARSDSEAPEKLPAVLLHNRPLGMDNSDSAPTATSGSHEKLNILRPHVKATVVGMVSPRLMSFTVVILRMPRSLISLRRLMYRIHPHSIRRVSAMS
mmetsp:Transcript_13230/g.19933  ORF Transcript_13230/g.19933 Transcript_13230/m.19933 type:complete len:105 (+) Transcript_13230:160-474(+)